MTLPPPNLRLIRKTYLHDGAYAGFDGYQVWLWAERDGMTHAVALDPYTADALVRYLPEAFHQPLTDEEQQQLRANAKPETSA